MNWKRVELWATAATLVAMGSVGACGSESSGSTDDPSTVGDGGADTGIETDSSAPPIPDDGGNPPRCDASATAKPMAAAVSPVNLVVAFDRSGSMGKTPNQPDNTELRWRPVTSAMKTFFSDPHSGGLRASLQYFPLLQNAEVACTAPPYANRSVPLTALPSTAFGRSIDNQTPTGGSVIRPALAGAIEAAKDTARQHPGEKTAVLLVTDGEPNGCDSTKPIVIDIARQAFEGSPSIPTYVVGVGPDKAFFNDVANAGGTGQPIYVAAGEPPAKASDALLAAVDKLRPPPPSCP